MVLNKLQRSLEVFAAFVFLNLVWLLYCLPVLTLFPSTMSLFSIVRNWKVNGIDYSIGKQFHIQFKENLQNYFLFGIIWIILGFILYIDFHLIFLNIFPGKSVLIGLLLLGTFLYIGMSLFFFSITANFRYRKKDLIKNSFLYTVGKLGTTSLVFLFLISIIIICYFVPLTTWVIGSLTAYFIYLIISRNWDLNNL